MGKLIRKRTTVVKKKKKSETEPVESEQDVNPSGIKDVSQSGSDLKNPVVKKTPLLNPAVVKPKSGLALKIPFLEKSIQFLREVKVELKKVAWPSRKQTIGSTIVVLILVFMIAIFLGIVDMGLAGLIKVVL
jgi:preprotein translocase subunit SecE